ncbi:HlyD family efflux transporter periplasmic adaptor subunit [Neisseria meningitidis]|nr:HlyD family efflux transporter periplasmic adaptor subunit [Neisseria meningitidis]MBH5800192.1 HlyD family efflux transporter periplasmic adaptor subunit [Neisseria meningitidis]MBH6188472.1 HlyD family efflux transporter periplasmic adaptor subunit [Neisseria meningitidis]MBH6194190.1 HlyD family efflux transporter periplasmic adaptor subunit [Neisseria meningitidis]MBH6198023.1 HlyD family efflux transporter periplasmic adaptor subunit [Neisseria meningitidis]
MIALLRGYRICFLLKEHCLYEIRKFGTQSYGYAHGRNKTSKHASQTQTPPDGIDAAVRACRRSRRVGVFLWWQHEEETEDAYVAGRVVQVTPQKGGTVRKVLHDDTDAVKKGDVLAVLDDDNDVLAYERAKNELVQAVRQNRRQNAATSQAGAQVALRRADLARAQDDLRRRSALAESGAVSAEELAHARAAVSQAQAAVKAALAEESSARAALGGDVSLREQPAVQTAIGRLKDAWLNFQRTQIRAPADGQVAKRSVQVGQQVAAGAPLMAVVPLSDVWVDANFKEMQLRHMKIGQPAELVSDLYGKQIVYRGRVAGFSAGTGSAFSLIPAQNATGNWIKVVQRVPVRIVLNREDVDRHPLRIGLSMTVKVDTSAAGAPVSKTPGAALPEMESTDWSEVDRTVDEILGQSAP